MRGPGSIDSAYHPAKNISQTDDELVALPRQTHDHGDEYRLQGVEGQQDKLSLCSRRVQAWQSSAVVNSSGDGAAQNGVSTAELRVAGSSPGSLDELAVAASSAAPCRYKRGGSRLEAR